jgi:hypothetical protein
MKQSIEVVMLEQSLRLKREFRTRREPRRQFYFLCWRFLLAAIFTVSPVSSCLIEHKTFTKDGDHFKYTKLKLNFEARG